MGYTVFFALCFVLCFAWADARFFARMNTNNKCTAKRFAPLFHNILCVLFFFIVCALVVLCVAANVDYFHMLFGWQSLRLFIFIVKWNYVIKSCVLLFVLRSKHMKRETNYLQHFPFYVIIGVIA